MTRNFSAFHASCTVCNVNFSQLIKITNSCSLLPLPHFNQKGSALGRQFRVYQMLSQNFSQIYLCRNFNQLLETALNCNCPKPKFLFLFRFVSEVLFIFFFFHSVSLLQSGLSFRSDLQSQNFLFLAMTFFFCLFLFTWPQISQILHTLFSPLDPFLNSNLVICHVVSREESPLSPEQQVLWTPVLNPGGTGPPRETSRRFPYGAVTSHRRSSLTASDWLLLFLVVRTFLGTKVVQKTDSDAFFLGCPTAISTPCMSGSCQWTRSTRNFSQVNHTLSESSVRCTIGQENWAGRSRKYMTK